MRKQKYNAFDIISGVSCMITAFLFILKSTGSIHMNEWQVYLPLLISSGIILLILLFSVLVFRFLGKPHEEKNAE